ncbi:MAG: DUF2069 domain-containing protein [Steroidobacteraceae bacterium]
MSAARKARLATIWLWAAVAVSLLCWKFAGYSWLLCAIAVLALLAPLPGLVRGARYTYAWASLLATPYLIFVVTELLVNPAARWVGALSLFLTFAWFCAMVFYLRASQAHRG